MKLARALGIVFLALGLLVLLIEFFLVYFLGRIHLLMTGVAVGLVIASPTLIVFPGGPLYVDQASRRPPGSFGPLWEAAPLHHRIAWALAAVVGLLSAAACIFWLKGMLPLTE